MSKAHVCNTRLDNPLRFRLSRIKETGFFITEINDREKISQTPNKYITSLNYADKILLVFPGGSSGASLC